MYITNVNINLTKYIYCITFFKHRSIIGFILCEEVYIVYFVDLLFIYLQIMIQT